MLLQPVTPICIDVRETLVHAGATIKYNDDDERAVAVIDRVDWIRLIILISRMEEAGRGIIRPSPIRQQEDHDRIEHAWTRVMWGAERVLVIDRPGLVKTFPDDALAVWQNA